MVVNARKLLIFGPLLFGLLLEAAPAPAPAGDWPQFRGPNRDSISPETGLLKVWPAEGPKLLWTNNQCGSGSHGSVAVAGGRIFLGGTGMAGHAVVALDLDGKLLWRTPTSCPEGRRSGSSSSTPTYQDGRVYYLGPYGRVAAFDAENGRQLWMVDLVKEFGARFGQYCVAESVTVDGEQVICTPGGPKGLMVGLDRKTGATRWAVTRPDDEAAYCTPVLVTWRGVRQAITVTRNFVISVDVDAGKLLWSRPFKTPLGENAVTPVFRDGLVLVTSSHEAGCMLLKINPDQTGVKDVWVTEAFGNCHGGVVLLGDNLYGSSCHQEKRSLCVVDFKTGALRRVDGDLPSGSLFCADGLLYCRTANDWVALLEPTPEGYRTVSRFRRSTRGGCYAHPVVCGGRMYLRYAGQLSAYDVRGSSGAATRPSQDQKN